MTDAISSALAGLNRYEARIGKTAERLASAAFTDPQAGASAADIVDLSTEAVALIESQAGYESLLNVLKAEKELAQSTIALLG